MADTNRKFRYKKPIESLRQEALKSFAQGVDVLLFGHFHTLWTFVDGKKTAMVVPAWLETRQALMVEESGRWIGVDADLLPVEFVEVPGG